MSVWKKVESNAVGKNVKLNILEKALKKMDISLNKNVKELKNGFGSDKCFAALVNSKGKITDVGIDFTDKGGLQVVGDLWCSGLNFRDGGHQELLDTIAHNYQVEHIKAKAKEELWTVTEKKINGKVELELIRY